MHKLIASVPAVIFTAVLSFAPTAYAQVGIDVYGETSVDDIGVTTNTDIDASVDMGEDAADSSFSLSKKEAASMSIDAESAELSADAVVTGGDLSRFATSRMKRDQGIEHIEASKEGVSVEYRQEARFLGFIPGSIRATAEVSSNGEVDIDYPWYRFLFSVDSTDESALRASVSEITSGADLSAGLSAHLEAQLIDVLHTALQGPVSA